MRLLLVFISFFLFFPQKDLDCLNCSDDNEFSILVITETKGFVHKSIDAGIDLIKLIADSNKFNVYFSNTSDIITDENLEYISSIIFLNTVFTLSFLPICLTSSCVRSGILDLSLLLLVLSM